MPSCTLYFSLADLFFCLLVVLFVPYLLLCGGYLSSPSVMYGLMDEEYHINFTWQMTNVPNMLMTLMIKTGYK